MFTEALQLRIQVGIVPIGLQHGRFEVVRHERLGNAAEMTERILKTLNEVVGRLSKDRFAVRLARMTQDDAEDVRFRRRPSESITGAPLPKSTCASWPGSDSMRRKGKGETVRSRFT